MHVGALQHSLEVHVLLAQTTVSFEPSMTRFVAAQSDDQTLEPCCSHVGFWFPGACVGIFVGVSLVDVVEVVGALVVAAPGESQLMQQSLTSHVAPGQSPWSQRFVLAGHGSVHEEHVACVACVGAMAGACVGFFVGVSLLQSHGVVMQLHTLGGTVDGGAVGAAPQQ